MDLGIFDKFEMKLKKKECTTQELKKKNGAMPSQREKQRKAAARQALQDMRRATSMAHGQARGTASSTQWHMRCGTGDTTMVGAMRKAPKTAKNWLSYFN
ncbi:hypothetical protein HAX54_034860 [Datura stramonium]|uniref:Uncharacterized protein n=1 Tax=Datura stramonium TaxID=4076 RepID=A0ABS8VFE2_DATST|nr:hypothetical protein [Datura stramonium]